MLEIILLIFLTKKIGNLAVQKGFASGRWKLYTVLAWLAGEFVGVVAGMMIFGTENLSWMFLGFAGAFAAYFLLKGWLSKQPDEVSGDDINNIGRG